MGKEVSKAPEKATLNRRNLATAQLLFRADSRINYDGSQSYSVSPELPAELTPEYQAATSPMTSGENKKPSASASTFTISPALNSPRSSLSAMGSSNCF